MGENNVREKDFYKEKIVELINGIERIDILEYIYYFLKEKFKISWGKIMAKVEIKTKHENTHAFTEIYVDGHKLDGVRRFELKQEVGNELPILTVDLSFMDLAIDVELLKINQYGMGEIKDIVFKEDGE